MRAIAERESHAPRHEQGGPGKLERVNAPRGSTTAARGCSASKPVRATRSRAHSYAVCSEATRLWRVTSAIAAPGPSAQSAPRVELVDRLTSRSRWPKGRIVWRDRRQHHRLTDRRAMARPTLLTWTRGLRGTNMRVELCAGTTMNVAQWLNAIDLGQYEALFREHEIDAGVLPDLVEADLEKIGVPLGHRKRLMRAIAALSAGETPPSAAKPASAKPSPWHCHI